MTTLRRVSTATLVALAVATMFGAGTASAEPKDRTSDHPDHPSLAQRRAQCNGTWDEIGFPPQGTCTTFDGVDYFESFYTPTGLNFLACWGPDPATMMTCFD